MLDGSVLLFHRQASCLKELRENLISSGGQLNPIITHYFPLQESLTLHLRVNNSYCGMDRHLRQCREKRRGSILMKHRWE